MNKRIQKDTYQDVELQERVVLMNRVAKVVKGGRRFSFSALTVVGDASSRVGIGFGKAKEVPEAIRKSIENSKKNMIEVKKQKLTIPHQVIGKFKSATVFLKPGAPGTGIIAGEAVRAVVELGGIQDLLTKRYGSSNKLNIVKATINALKQISTFEEAKQRRGLSISKLFGEHSRQRREEKKIQLGESEIKENIDANSSESSQSENTKSKADTSFEKKDVQVESANEIVENISGEGQQE